eukprot:TRINITY_DN65170_c0_g1_i1.p1 TRINITY_DN65170_c0_g1~~TRINITY_DN65170_c0_g1_i1.p1  ORF type:complete len:520 (+),score=113.99 TRINITY_DN65170_c0_g1_i1:141-1700(+)
MEAKLHTRYRKRYSLCCCLLIICDYDCPAPMMRMQLLPLIIVMANVHAEGASLQAVRSNESLQTGMLRFTTGCKDECTVSSMTTEMKRALCNLSGPAIVKRVSLSLGLCCRGYPRDVAAALSRCIASWAKAAEDPVTEALLRCSIVLQPRQADSIGGLRRGTIIVVVSIIIALLLTGCGDEAVAPERNCRHFSWPAANENYYKYVETVLAAFPWLTASENYFDYVNTFLAWLFIVGGWLDDTMGYGGKGKGGGGWVPQWMQQAAKDWAEEREKREDDERRQKLRADMEELMDKRLAMTQPKQTATKDTSLRSMVKREARRLMYQPSETTDEPMQDDISSSEMRGIIRNELKKQMASGSKDTGLPKKEKSKNEKTKSKKAKSSKRGRSSSSYHDSSDVAIVEKEKEKAANKPKKPDKKEKGNKAEKEHTNAAKRLVLPTAQRKDADGVKEEVRYNILMALHIEELPIEGDDDGVWDEMVSKHRRCTLGALKELCRNLGGPTTGSKMDNPVWLKQFTQDRL